LRDKEIKDGNGNVIGKVLTSLFNCGIAIVEKEKLENATNTKFSIDDMNAIIYDPVSLWESIRDVQSDNEKEGSEK
jgi:hypothetical protein